MPFWPHPDLTWAPRPDASSQDAPSQRLWGPEKCPLHPQLHLCGMKRFRCFTPSPVTGWQRRPGGGGSPASKDMQGRDEMKAPASDPRSSLSVPSKPPRSPQFPSSVLRKPPGPGQSLSTPTGLKPRLLARAAQASWSSAFSKPSGD